MLIHPNTRSASALPANIKTVNTCDVLVPRQSRVSVSVEQRVAMNREQHAKLRALANAAMPEAKTIILVTLSSGHHAFTNLSYVATRDKQGLWTVDRFGRTTNELSEIIPENEPVTRSVLTRDVGKGLDGLVANSCLYAQPFMTADSGLPPLNGWSTSLTVITPKRKYVGYAFGPIPSIGGKVVTAVTGW